MDNIYYDLVLCAHARPCGIPGRQIREEDNFASGSATVHHRMDFDNLGPISGLPLHITGVLRTRLRHRVHSRSYVYRRNRYK